MNGEITTTMPVTPMSNNNGDGLFGSGSGSGGWIWILLIFLLLGGRGLGGLGGNGAAADIVNNDFLYTQSKIDALSQAIISQTNQLNQSLNAGVNSINMGICNLGHQIDTGFCGINRNIDAVRFEAAQNTCAITNTIRDEGRLTRDLITSNVMQDLRDRNTELAGALNNCNQTASITAIVNGAINARFPYAVPANVVGYGYPGAMPVPIGDGNPYARAC